MVALPTHKQFPEAVILQLCQDPIRYFQHLQFELRPFKHHRNNGMQHSVERSLLCWI